MVLSLEAQCIENIWADYDQYVLVAYEHDVHDCKEVHMCSCTGVANREDMSGKLEEGKGAEVRNRLVSCVTSG